MEMTNSRVVPAPVAAVWQALNDPAALKACIPGCESLERIGDDEWRATVAAQGRSGLGEVQRQDAHDGQHAADRLHAEIRGAGRRGRLCERRGPRDAGARARRPDDADVHRQAQVGGKLAQIGSRLIDGAAAKLADDFFAKFSAQFAPAAAEGAPAMAARRAGREHILRRALGSLRRAGADPGHHGVVVCAGRRQVLGASSRREDIHG